MPTRVQPSRGLLQKVESAIAATRMLRARSDRVLVAVSGGSDSVALLAALSALGAGRWQIAVAHVNHRLRGKQSEADQRFVERLASSFQLELFVCDGQIEPGENLEERARVRRYELLLDLARTHGFRRIATGHTLNDQAETVLLRLLRGSGGTGLGGIFPVRKDGVIRPLLGCTRAEILEFLQCQRLGHRVDPSNRNPQFTRNRIRRRLLPRLERDFNPAIQATLARTAALIRDDEAYLEHRAGKALGRSLFAGRLVVDRVRRLAPALQRRVLRLWLASARGGLRGVGAGHVESVRSLLSVRRGRLSIPGGTVVRSGGSLRWGGAVVEEGTIDLIVRDGDHFRAGAWMIRCQRGKAVRPGRWRAIFALKSLGGLSLRVRSPRAGDRLRPLGLGGSKKLQDVFVDAKVPREKRASWIVVDSPHGILWVPGLVRAEAATVAGNVSEVLVIEARRTREANAVAGE